MSQDLRYPIGKPDLASPASDESRAAVIAAIEELPANLRAAVAGLSDAQLDTPYRPDGWTVRQLVHHVADSHMNAITRIRLALTEENPTIKPYLEKGWAELSDSRTLGVEPSLAILDGVHARWTALMRALPAASWSRTVIHPERGSTMSIDALMALYAWHSKHHVAHITGLRQREGW